MLLKRWRRFPFRRCQRGTCVGAGQYLQLETLEHRLLPSITVTNTNDSGPGSLRDAITQINADTSHTLYPSPSNRSPEFRQTGAAAGPLDS
jgi:hypothetical protein